LPWQSLSKLDSAHLAYKKLTLRSARSKIGLWGGDAPTEFYKE